MDGWMDEWIARSIERQPGTSIIRSDAPLRTRCCSVNSCLELTMPKSLTTCGKGRIEVRYSKVVSESSNAKVPKSVSR